MQVNIFLCFRYTNQIHIAKSFFKILKLKQTAAQIYPSGSKHINVIHSNFHSLHKYLLSLYLCAWCTLGTGDVLGKTEINLRLVMGDFMYLIP